MLAPGEQCRSGQGSYKFGKLTSFFTNFTILLRNFDMLTFANWQWTRGTAEADRNVIWL